MSDRRSSLHAQDKNAHEQFPDGWNSSAAALTGVHPRSQGSVTAAMEPHVIELEPLQDSDNESVDSDADKAESVLTTSAAGPVAWSHEDAAQHQSRFDIRSRPGSEGAPARTKKKRKSRRWRGRASRRISAAISQPNSRPNSRPDASAKQPLLRPESAASLPSFIEPVTSKQQGFVSGFVRHLNLDELGEDGITRDNKVNSATQTDAFELVDFSFLPSAHLPQPNQLHHRKRGTLASHHRFSKMMLQDNIDDDDSDSDAGDAGATLELDAPKRLQKRNNYRRNLGRCGLIYYDLKTWLRLKRHRRHDPIPIWRTAIKKIEGAFGSSVVSFFVFVRWVFLLNLFLSVVGLSFVVIPQAVFFDYGRITERFNGLNLIDGKGPLGQSYMFYGGYSDRIGDYRMDLAYILVPIVLFFGCFFFILRNIAHALGSVSSSGALVQTDHRMPFGVFTLASWDYTIDAEDAVKNLQLGITNAIRDTIHEHDAVRQRELASDAFDWKVFGGRCLAWFLWLIIVACSFAAVWFSVQEQVNASSNDFISTYAAVAVFSIINGALPLVIKRLVYFEDYKHPRTSLGMTIARTFLLRVLTIYALMYGYFEKTELAKVQLPVYSANATVEQENCAGTVIGQEVYKLVLIDSAVSMLQRLGATLFWYYWLKHRIELDMVQNVLQLVYRQALIWMGMPFCPLLPVVAMLTNVAFFYFYFALVRRFCRSPTKRWSQNRNNTLFMFYLVLMLFLVSVPLTYGLRRYKPNCGPYAKEVYDSWFDAIWEWAKSRDGAVKDFIETVSSPIIVIPFIVILCVWIYFANVKVRRTRRRLRETHRELAQLRRDRRELLQVNAQQVLEKTQHAALSDASDETGEDDFYGHKQADRRLSEQQQNAKHFAIDMV